jgi:hypothetical protein
MPDALKLSVKSGPAVVPQHIPRAVTSAPPSSVTSPVITAELTVIALACPVVKTGSTGSSAQLFINIDPPQSDSKSHILGSLVLLDIIEMIILYLNAIFSV